MHLNAHILRTINAYAALFFQSRDASVTKRLPETHDVGVGTTPQAFQRVTGKPHVSRESAQAALV